MSYSCTPRRPWRLLLPNKSRLSTYQQVSLPAEGGGRCVQVLPSAAQHGSTVISIDNPHVLVSLLANTGETTAEIDMDFNRVFPFDAPE